MLGSSRFYAQFSDYGKNSDIHISKHLISKPFLLREDEASFLNVSGTLFWSKSQKLRNH